MRYPIYRLLRLFIKPFMKFFYCVEYQNLDNIPDEEVIFAGNHKSNLDCLFLMSSTKKTIHFLAKKELMNKYGWFFKRMAIIPVDRKVKNKEAIIEAEKVLNQNESIGIFPEGTFNKTEYVIKPFKYGAVKIASDTKKKIVPFAIINDYKLFHKSVKIIFGKPYNITDKNDLTKENIMLMNKIIKLLRSDQNE